MCTLQTGKTVIMPSLSITSLCLCMYVSRIARELSLSSVTVLRKGVCSLLKPLKLRSAMHVDRINQQSYESYIILRDRIVVGMVKSLNHCRVCGFTFGSISLHLISKRIKEILTQKHQYNAKYLSQFNDKNAFGKRKSMYFFPDFNCMHRHMCLYARYIPGSRNSW